MAIARPLRLAPATLGGTRSLAETQKVDGTPGGSAESMLWVDPFYFCRALLE
jgi:hypothetical protein